MRIDKLQLYATMEMNFRSTILKEGNSHKECMLDYPIYMKYEKRQNEAMGLGQLSGYSKKVVTGRRPWGAGHVLFHDLGASYMCVFIL